MSLRTTDLEEANFLQGEDQFIFFQNSSRRVKRVRRSNMFASPGVSTDLSDVISGANELLSYTLTGDPVFQDYTGFVGQKQQFLEQASGFLDQRRQFLDQASGFLDQRRQMLDIATGLLNETGNQIRQQVVALNTSLTGASGVLRSSIDTVYIVATGASGTIAARIEELNSQYTGTTGSLGSTVTNFTVTFANATGALATDISTLNSTFTGSGFALGAAIQDARDTAVNISGALATRVGELNVAFTGASGVLRSSITTVESGYVNASGAIASRITDLNVAFTGASGVLRAGITNAESGYVNASGALAERISTLNASLTGASGTLRATITTVESGYVNASGALAERITSVNASFTGASGTLRAGINDVQSSFVNGSGALADRITSVNASLTGASGVLRAGITGVETAFVNASGALAFRIDGVQAAVNGVSGSVETETSARVNAVSGVSGAVALNWGIKLSSNSGVIGAIKMVGDGSTSAFLVITDFFQVKTNSNPNLVPAGASTSDVTLLTMNASGIVFGADIASNNYIAGSAGWAIKRLTGDAEFNNIKLRGQILGGTTLGTDGDSAFGLTVNSQYGIRRSRNDATLTLTGGSGNGILNGSQIDMVGTNYVGVANAEGQMIISAGYKAGLTDETQGAVIFRTCREYGNQNRGAVRMRIQMDGTVRIFNAETGTGASDVPAGAPNDGSGKLIVDKSVTAETYTSTSSRRFKKRIRNLKNGLQTLSKLRPVIFDWKTKDLKNDIGLIAEEVNEIAPNIVGLDNSGQIIGIDYGKLTPILIQAIKELSLEVQRLKNKIG